jgi:hypothetical protein
LPLHIYALMLKQMHGLLFLNRRPNCISYRTV